MAAGVFVERAVMGDGLNARRSIRDVAGLRMSPYPATVTEPLRLTWLSPAGIESPAART
jgi:hypothetical protein